MVHAGLAIVTLAALAGAPGDAPKNAEAAVTLAKNAFEFGDFKTVITVLDPWLHPPRIIDRKLMLEARRIMGVTQHSVGNVVAAKEEFGQLLLLDPKHELDAFLIPPTVIATFEAVREEMRATLDELIGRKVEPPPPKGPEVTTEIRLVEVPPTFAMYLPGGLPQFLLEEYGWGVTWLTLQVVSLAANLYAHFAANDLKSDTGSFKALFTVQYAGLLAFAGAWIGSAVQGHYQLDDVRSEIIKAAPSTPPEARTGPTSGPAMTLTFDW